MREVKGHQQPEILYGRRKMTAWLDRGEFDRVSKSKHTINRLMSLEGMSGLLQGRKPRALKSAGNASARAAHLRGRNFRAPCPNHSLVTDFTYVPARQPVRPHPRWRHPARPGPRSFACAPDATPATGHAIASAPAQADWPSNPLVAP